MFGWGANPAIGICIYVVYSGNNIVYRAILLIHVNILD